MADALSALAEVMGQGLASQLDASQLLQALFNERYYQRAQWASRNALSLAGSGDRGEEAGVPFAGLIHPDNPPSGPYGGVSLVWFPTKEQGSLLTFVVGTRGLSPDEGLLTRHGHRRRIAALRRYLRRNGIVAWTKADPTALGQDVPRAIRTDFNAFEHVFKKYGTVIYAMAHVPADDPARARVATQAFFDLYARERGWPVRTELNAEYQAFQFALDADISPPAQAGEVHDLLRRRRFVVLQGPPGTGKTRMAELIRDQFFAGHGMTIQFHPAVTYEDFMVGLSPDPADAQLRFRVRPGWLLEAARQAKEGPFLLVIDEVNRADLGKVLGEAIYLFEPAEVGGERPRHVQLPHAVNGETHFTFPENLYVMATMNTADRSIAGMDLAVRRRFAFVTVPPDRNVVAEKGPPIAGEVFSRLLGVFVEHAPDDALSLMPGHSYFIADSDAELLERFRYELIPLLDEYLREGLLGPAAAELYSVRNYIEDVVVNGPAPG